MRGRDGSRERGMVLITSLLLLVVVTILAVGMFRSFGLDEKIASNMRDKQAALNAAESAEVYAEQWLATNGLSASNVTCTGMVAYTATQVCLNVLPSSLAPGTTVANLPWQISGASVGVNYTPSTMTISGVNGAASGGINLASAPVYYISYLGIGTAPNGGTGQIYQIDAAAYGVNPSTAAVVESTYIIQSISSNLGLN